MVAVLAALWFITITDTPPLADNMGTCTRPVLVPATCDSITVHWRAWAIQDVRPVFVPSWRPIEDSTRVRRGLVWSRTIPVLRDTLNYWGCQVWQTRLSTRHVPRVYVQEGCGRRSRVLVPRVQP